MIYDDDAVLAEDGDDDGFAAHQHECMSDVPHTGRCECECGAICYPGFDWQSAKRSEAQSPESPND